MAIIGLFCFQLSRVYFVDQVDAFYTCPNTQVWTSAASDDNAADAQAAGSNSEEFAGFLASEPDGQTTVRSCKNSADGLGLSPVQPLGTPAATSIQRPETNWVRHNRIADSAPDADIPTHLLPPRSLS